jgi:hypothetical protein
MEVMLVDINNLCLNFHRYTGHLSLFIVPGDVSALIRPNNHRCLPSPMKDTMTVYGTLPLLEALRRALARRDSEE